MKISRFGILGFLVILATISLSACGLLLANIPIYQVDEPNLYSPYTATANAVSIQITKLADVFSATHTASPVPPTPTPTPYIETFLPGVIRGNICFPSEVIPEMQAYFQEINTGALYDLTIRANQTSYQRQLPAGNYQVFAWLPGFELGGSYSKMVECGLDADCGDHSLVFVEVLPGSTRIDVDICDWYGGKGSVPYPSTYVPAVPTFTPTATPLPCNRAQYIKDVTVSDGTTFHPEEAFTKVWRLKNTGACTWTEDYDLVFQRGTEMGERISVSLQGIVRPGETVDLSVDLTAPDEVGKHRGYWQLRDDRGVPFGIGGNADKSFWVDIEVVKPCNWVKFVSDISIIDGTTLTPRAPFTKTWRLKNIGSCTWNRNYDLVFVDGNRMEAKKVKSLPAKVRPGKTIDLSLPMKAPKKPGEYTGYWMLRDQQGNLFGISHQADKEIWVNIEVVKPDHDYDYDFALNFCAAEWSSGDGRLSCPSPSSSQAGFVRQLSDPVLEIRHENEPALWLRPNAEHHGWISGTYPAIEIQEGDHFQAWIGCLDDSKGCNVTFFLEFQNVDGRLLSLGEWHEVYDGEVTKIDLDLSQLAGELGQFTLSVEVNNHKPQKANAFWFVPHISHFSE